MPENPNLPELATKVMVVEDEVVIAMDTCNQLEDFGYKVVANAFSGEQAISEATQHSPEIVIMDIVLSGSIDGIMAAQTIIESLQIPVIFLTAYSDPITLGRAKISGASSYLIKPYRFAELHACIEIALHKHHTERKLREREHWYAKTLHCMNEAVIATDAEGKIRFMNPVAETLTGVQLVKSQGKTVNDILALLNQPNRTIAENPVLKSLNILSVTGLDSKGQPKYQPVEELTLGDGPTPILDDDGGLLGDAYVFRDIDQFYNLAMAERTLERMIFENGLRMALTNHELKLYYQPQIDLATGCMVCSEGIVLWPQPEGVVMNPDRFDVVAEETGLIVPIGNWALRTACLQAESWEKSDGEFASIALKISKRQFLEDSFYQMVVDVLTETGLNPSALELEILESALMHDPERSLLVLQQLNKLGVRLSIDNFGVGYSSLTYLRQFPINSIKIARPFVQNLPHDKGSTALVWAIIALAHELGLEVTAVGVETEEQLAFLKQHKCDRVQGVLN
jgi:EAL domain-containing protein (putative c-di-GMP-specific phosphodiesterase class I)/DNA-binding response OmpR family regulator